MLRRALVLVLSAILILVAHAEPRLRGDHSPLSHPGDKVLVLFFVATDCPISNRSFPELQRLRSLFATRGVRLWAIYPNTNETNKAVRLHQAQFDPSGNSRLDHAGDLVALAHAHVTPEVSILVRNGASWRPVYTGRIDDHYIHLGLQRPAATAHFAEDAIRAVLNGTPVPAATGNPVGCAILNPRAEIVPAAHP